MSWRNLLHVMGVVVAAIGAAMTIPIVVSIIYQEWSDVPGLVMSAVVTFLIGITLRFFFGSPGELSTREGFAAVGMAWTAMALLGSLPYLLTGGITDISNAVFESASGFTTTGATTVSDPALLSHGVVFWRSLTQWIGGMGIIVLSVAVLPLLGMGAVQLARAESPGPTPDRLTPRFSETAKRLWYVYVVLTVLQVLLLTVSEMSLFEAINYTFATLSTGGFAMRASSPTAYSSYAQWVMIVFMALAGMSFALHYTFVTKDRLAYFKSVGLRVYLGIMAAAATLMVIGTWGGSVLVTIRDSVFTTVTVMTTTGFGTVDFTVWGPALQLIIVGLMFVGGMAGSTSGSIKADRLLILSEASRTDVRRLIHPRGVFVTRIGKKPVPDVLVETVQTFFLLYMFAFMSGVLVVAVIGFLASSSLDMITIVSGVASALGNVGPGLGEIGPTGTWAVFPAASQWVLSGLMVIGRLEILPILILLSPEVWRK